MRTQSFPSTQLWSWESSALIVRAPRGPTRFFRERAGGSVTFPRQNSRYVRRASTLHTHFPGNSRAVPGSRPWGTGPAGLDRNSRSSSRLSRCSRARSSSTSAGAAVAVRRGTAASWGDRRAERGAPRIVGPAGPAAQGPGWLRRPVRAAVTVRGRVATDVAVSDPAIPEAARRRLSGRVRDPTLATQGTSAVASPAAALFCSRTWPDLYQQFRSGQVPTERRARAGRSTGRRRDGEL